MIKHEQEIKLWKRKIVNSYCSISFYYFPLFSIFPQPAIICSNSITRRKIGWKELNSLKHFDDNPTFEIISKGQLWQCNEAQLSFLCNDRKLKNISSHFFLFGLRVSLSRDFLISPVSQKFTAKLIKRILILLISGIARHIHRNQLFSCAY